MIRQILGSSALLVLFLLASPGWAQALSPEIADLGVQARALETGSTAQ